MPKERMAWLHYYTPISLQYGGLTFLSQLNINALGVIILYEPLYFFLLSLDVELNYFVKYPLINTLHSINMYILYNVVS